MKTISKIVLEPGILPSPARSGLRRRELSLFLSRASAAVGLAGEVSVLLTGNEAVRALNRDFRGKDKTTDVLSFPAPPFPGNGYAGDLAISLETARSQAAEQGHALQEEVQILMLHGLLHLAGFDHERDAGEMARRELALRKLLALPPGLIERGRKKPASTRRIPRPHTKASRRAAGPSAGNSRSPASKRSPRGDSKGRRP